MTVARTLHEAFAAQAAATPDRIALTCDTGQVSYGELDRRSSRLAESLRSRRLPLETRIGLCAERGTEMVIGALAILRSGAAYVPIDPTYPAERMRYIIEDSGVAMILATPRTAARLPPCNIPIAMVSADDATADQTDADTPTLAVPDRALAYVMYTSGSTGRPKGVMIEHRSALRLFERTRGKFAFDSSDVWTLFHSMSFDVSVWEMWGALLTGAKLIVVPTALTRAPEQFAALIDAARVTVLSQTPSAFRQFSQAYLRVSRPTALRVIVFAGEALPNRLLESWVGSYGDERPMLVNMYGITETTVHLTFHRVVRAQLRERHSFIGEPIDDMRIHLLGDRQQPVPAEVPGRIYVSGPGVARGYLQRPGLTAQRFIASDDGEGDHTRLYDSGDIAMRLTTGDLVYLGRSDDQVKVRGFRIEPREIESCLEEDTGVAAIVVVAEDLEGEVNGLVAYVVPHDTATLRSDAGDRFMRGLAAKAHRELPNHLQPADYRLVAALPLTTNGKIDRLALRGSR